LRKEKHVKIKIDEKTSRTVTVYEVRPADIFDIINKLDGEEEDRSIVDVLKEALPLLTDATAEDLLELYPSDQEEIFKAFKEINSPFLRTVQAVGLGKAAETVWRSLLTDFQGLVAGSFPPAMLTATPSTTA
jgi:inorganic pyrophosphatase